MHLAHTWYLTLLILAVFCGTFVSRSFLTYFRTHYEYDFHQKTLGSSSQEEVPKEFALATDDEWVPDDEWVLDEANMELIRVHKQMRKALYCRGPRVLQQVVQKL